MNAEVQALVERLRAASRHAVNRHILIEAADMLERLAGRVPMITLGGGLPGDHNGTLKAKRGELRKLAERTQKKNPGPWFVCQTPNRDGTMDLETGRTGQSEHPPAQRCEQPEADYIAAFSPDVVIELLDHIDLLNRAFTRHQIKEQP